MQKRGAPDGRRAFLFGFDFRFAVADAPRVPPASAGEHRAVSRRGHGVAWTLLISVLLLLISLGLVFASAYTLPSPLHETNRPDASVLAAAAAAAIGAAAGCADHALELTRFSGQLTAWGSNL